MTQPVVEVAGTSVAISVVPTEHAPRVYERIRHVWQRSLSTLPAESAEHDVALTLANPIDDESVASAMRDLTLKTTMEVLKHHAGTHVLLHGGAAADPETGATVAFVASSGSGKTTLSRVLAQDWCYLTDESVVVDDDGRVLPYVKPLSLVSDRVGRPKDETSPDDLGLREAHDRPVLAHLVLLERDPEATEVEVDDLHLVDALLGLAKQSSGMAEHDNGLAQLAALINRVGPVRRFRYAEASDIIEQLQARTLELHHQSRPEPTPFSSGRAAANPTEPDTVGLAEGTIWFESEGRHLAFNGYDLTELSELGGRVMQVVVDPLTEDELLAILIDEFGMPNGVSPAEALDNLLQQFFAKGWLRRGPSSDTDTETDSPESDEAATHDEPADPEAGARD